MGLFMVVASIVTRCSYFKLYRSVGKYLHAVMCKATFRVTLADRYTDCVIVAVFNACLQRLKLVTAIKQHNSARSLFYALQRVFNITILGSISAYFFMVLN